MDFCTADLCDEFGESVAVVNAQLRSFGGEGKCCGEIVTIRLDEDNGGLVAMLKEPGNGRVAVVDVGGSFVAVVGDTLMGYARDNNWAGIVVNGYVRDIGETQKIPVGLWALGTCPLKSRKKAAAERDVTLRFSGVDFSPGAYLYADDDGIIVAAENLLT